jgi:capsular polysaccharide biosynthesis protein
MEQNTNEEEIEIDLREVFAILLGKIWIILMAGLGMALAAFLVCKFVFAPQYQSTTQIYVMNKEDASSSAVTFSDLQSGAQLTQDYMTLITSRPVTERVIAELGLDMKPENLAGIISVENPENTRILSITVTYNDPFMARQIADHVRTASSDCITNVMGIDQVNMVEKANLPDQPSSPHVGRDTVIGGGVGIVLSAFIIILVHILDDTIKTPDHVEKYLGMSVLSSIPLQEDMKKDGKKKKWGKKKKKPEEEEAKVNYKVGLN